MAEKEYSWQQNELGGYSYAPVKRKRHIPGWIIAAIVAAAVTAAGLTAYSLWILPNIRPTTVISYSGSSSGGEETAPAAADNGTGFIGMGERLGDSVVAIVSRGVSGGFFSQMMSTGGGSGVVVSADGYILTNSSILSSGTDGVTVRTADGSEYEAEIVGSDARTDCAILKIAQTGMTPIEFADSDTVSSGVRVAALGRILNSQLGTTLTEGIVCGVSKSVSLQNGQTINLIQTDATSSGSSGSIILNSDGKAVGMVTSMISTSTDEIALAIPSNDIVQVLESIINTGYAPAGLSLGIRAQDAEYGVIIEAINEDSAAAKAGLKVGDLIMKADGTPVKTVSEINKIRDSHTAGEVIVLTVYRDGETLDIEVKLG